MTGWFAGRGADLPFADPRRAHGVAMEGYFWRFSDPASGRVLVALCGVCRDARGESWATVALAAHPGGRLRWADLPRAGADPAALGAWASDGEPAGRRFRADARGVEVDLGPGARLRAAITGPWPVERRRAALGGSGAGHLVPGLGQYWHPHLLGGRVSGEAELGGERVSLAGFDVYGEKNWGGGGFPAQWWWGQAQGFPEAPEVCVAFAGGRLGPGSATGVVVRLPDGSPSAGRPVRLGNPLLAPARVATSVGRWSVHARGPRWSIELEGAADPARAHVLPVPEPRARRSVPAAHEQLAGRLALVVRHRGRVVFGGESALAGLELGRRA